MTDDRARKNTVRRRIERTGEKYTQARRAVEETSTDPLTGLGSRHAMARTLRRKLDCGGPISPISVVSLDLDGFDAVNDAHGYERGDEMLVQVAAVVRGLLGGRDEVFREGGDEFLGVTPRKNLDETVGLAERMRAEIERLRVPLPESAGELRVTASIGVASVPERAADTGKPGAAAGKAVYRAKAARYRAKAAGGNRVEHTD